LYVDEETLHSQSVGECMSIRYVITGMACLLVGCEPPHFQSVETGNKAVLEIQMINRHFHVEDQVYLNQALDQYPTDYGLAARRFRVGPVSAEASTPTYDMTHVSIAADKPIDVLYIGIKDVEDNTGKGKGCRLAFTFTPEINAYYVFRNDVRFEKKQEPDLIDKVFGIDYEYRCYVFLSQKKGSTLVDVPVDLKEDHQDMVIRLKP
jgi:hypothetical protein